MTLSFRNVIVTVTRCYIIVNPCCSQSSSRYIRTDYKYDLVSNKVNQVAYQKGKQDQLFHKYAYDSDNRITHVYTSTDNVTWKLEAKYFYFDHGPLERVELGGGVKGVDYAYALQGWIKGVNSNTLVSSRDIGRDGENGLHKNFARDEAGYTLGYYEGDYTSVNVPSGSSFAATTAGSDLAANNLYNGNISHMVTAIGKFMPNGAAPQAMSYTYDQLHRIQSATQHTDADVTTTNAWSAGTATEDYKEQYTYDANGNILTQKRNAYGTNRAMEELTYVYENKVNGYERTTNKLRQVTDAVALNEWEDIESQGADNYAYDEIGNLISDNSEGITAISWTVSGKVKQVAKADGTLVTFGYDAQGNRISKRIQRESEDRTTYYVRDASGNVLSIYEKDQVGLKAIEQPIYGSDRIGQRSEAVLITGEEISNTDYQDYKGNTNYELKNHLGNVLAVVSDKSLAIESATVPGTTGHYVADLTSANNYSSFGAQQPGLSFNSKIYRYGFNGKEKDDNSELGSTVYDYGMRIYNPGIGKFLSVDPLGNNFPWNSIYAYAENDVVRSIDLDGLEKVALSGAADPTQYYPNGTAYNSTHVKYFKAQATRLQKQYGYHASQVFSGRDIIDKLVQETKNHGNITSFVIFTHGGTSGFYLNNNEGFYSIPENNMGGAGAVSVADLQEQMKTGASETPAYEFVMATGVTTIAATGSVSMVDETKADGRFKTDGEFLKLTRVEYEKVSHVANPDKSWWEFWEESTIEVKEKVYHVIEESLGNEVNMDDYIKK